MGNIDIFPVLSFYVLIRPSLNYKYLPNIYFFYKKINFWYHKRNITPLTFFLSHTLSALLLNVYTLNV